MRSLDDDQRAAVRVRGTSVVAAGAGSGKTTVLAERYLSLIASGEAEVQGILTLTFTRKAAAEMHSRIFTLLRSRQGENPLFRKALQDFDSARISTLDSFASEVARAGCAGYGLPPNFVTDEDAYAELCRREALEFILRKTTDPTMAWMTSEYGIEALWEQVLVPIAQNYMKPGDPYDFTGVWKRQQTALARELPRLLNVLDSELLMLSETTDTGKLVSDARQAAEACLPLLGRHTDELLPLLERVHKIKKSGSRKGDYEVLASCVDAIKPASASAIEIIQTQVSAEEITRVYELLQEFQDRVIAAKQDAAVLGFADVFSLALRILREQTDIRRYYHAAISHIMIDEFQDNNEEQKEFIELVAGANSIEHPADLFYVGDEKQSIYRFRGADVRVFKTLSESLSATGGTRRTIATNYRSDPVLIAVFNAIFPSVFGSGSEAYEAGFTPLKDRGGASDTSAPVLQLFLKHEHENTDASPGTDLIPDTDAEALFVADYIAKAVRDAAMTVNDGTGGRRSARFDDFAILLRTTSHQQTFEQMLRRLDVPYRTDSVRSIYLEALANDLYSLLQLCLFPEDRRALATVLRSPLSGLSDDAVFELLGQKVECFSDAVNVEKLTRDDQSRYEQLNAMYRDVRSRAAHEPTSDLLHRIWYDYGYRYEYLSDPANHSYLEYYDYLIAYSKQAGRDNLVVFLDALRPNLGKAERLSDVTVLGRRSHGVHLMTVHKSKGLQFPFVIVASAEQGSLRGRNSSYLYDSDEYGLTIAAGSTQTDTVRTGSRANWFHTQGREEDRLQERAEMRRLLYVAMTRAEQLCIVTAVRKKPPKKSPEPGPGEEKSFLDLILPPLSSIADSTPLVTSGVIPDYTLIQSLGMGRRHGTPDTTSLRESLTKAPRRRPVLRLEWSVVALNEAMVAYQAHDTQRSSEPLPALPVDSVLDRYGLHAAFGTVTHWFAASELDGRSTGMPPNLERLFPLEVRDELVASAQSLARQAVTGVHVPAGAAIHSELPFVLALGVGARVLTANGVIDLAIVGSESVQVIDFKTDAVRTPDGYRYQMDMYRRAASSLFARETVVVDTLYLRDMKTVRSEPVETSEYETLIV